MARGFAEASSFPPCDTLLGIACASIEGSISNLYADSGLTRRGDEGIAKGIPVLPRLELLRCAGASTSSMLRTGEATGLGLWARDAGLSARRPPGLWLPSRSFTTSLISSSMAASSDAMVAVVAGRVGVGGAVVGRRSRAGVGAMGGNIRKRMAAKSRSCSRGSLGD